MARKSMYNRNGSFSDYGMKIGKEVEAVFKRLIKKHAPNLTALELRELESVFHRSSSYTITLAIMDRRNRGRRH